jgi:hypothetical protein
MSLVSPVAQPCERDHLLPALSASRSWVLLPRCPRLRKVSPAPLGSNCRGVRSPGPSSPSQWRFLRFLFPSVQGHGILSATEVEPQLSSVSHKLSEKSVEGL